MFDRTLFLDSFQNFALFVNYRTRYMFLFSMAYIYLYGLIAPHCVHLIFFQYHQLFLHKILKGYPDFQEYKQNA